MKILITGVAGFIGSNLASALLNTGYEVVGIDNMSQGEKLNLLPLQENPAFTMHTIDILDKNAVIEAARGCQAIVHLAAYKIPRYSDAMDTLIINAQGSMNVIDAALENHAKLIAASTSDVYGKNKNIPFHEDSDLVIGRPTVKRWAYAISKMYAEQLYFAHHERNGLDFVVARFFGGYGPNQKMSWWGGPQSVFIDCALEDREMDLHGDGQQTRSFTYISDHVDGLIRMVESNEANNLVFNLGNTYEISIEGLARKIWNMVRPDQKPKLHYIPYASFGNYEDVQRRVPDITRSKEILGFSPRIDLDTGLPLTIEWQIKRRKQLGITT